jgi:ABC-type multidrug transport system fused ATPase/permease subunit
VIKNASLEIVVNAPDESMQSISSMAEEMGGFVVSANLYQTHTSDGQEVPRASITIRVPAERLGEALARIEAESDRLPLNKNINSQDVTSEYTDLQSRLTNLEAAEAQLMLIMEDANRTEDVLNVFDQLTRVREQIEVLKGQMQYLETSAKLSAISVELIPNEVIQPISIGGWEPVGVIKDAIQSLIVALQGLVNIGIWLALFILPIVLIIGVPLFFIIRGVRNRRRKSKKGNGQPESEAPHAEEDQNNE